MRSLAFNPAGRLLGRIYMALALLIWLTACDRVTPAQPVDRPPPLLLISIDGFRHDYFDLVDTPALDRLVKTGLKADSLQHVFPTKTFPTHYSIVTGVHPGTHGIVANSMWDPVRESRFSMRNRDAVGDGYWYEAAEPIWVTAERQGLIAATYFWPGSEARIHRIRPTYWKLYDASARHSERVEQVLAWMDLPAAERPDLYTLYFSSVDSLGHRHGPRAAQVGRALADIDRHIGDLLDGLQARGLLGNMHILVVSDHGMSSVDLDRYIMLDDYLDLNRVTVSDWGPAAQIWATGQTVEDIMTALDGAHPNMRAWRAADSPARYRFGSHHRVPDVLVEADLGWMISNKPYIAGQGLFSLKGMHGWDPAWLEMHGVFIAHGPAFRAGLRAPAVRSVDLYALMSKLLDLQPAGNEGSLALFQPYLNATEDITLESHAFTCDGELLEARIGPEHMALYWREQAHVLDRLDSEAGRQFEEVDLRFTLISDAVSAYIDGEDLGDCKALAQ